jgi:sarcosine oxidase subunit gamma
MADPAWMRITEPASRLILQCDREARAAAGAVWGVSSPEEPCRAQQIGNRAVLWLGPDEHLLWQASRTALPVEDLERALAPYPHSLVDVSHRQAGLEISGPHAADILAGACPLDLDLPHFPVQMCTRTVLAKAEILLWRTAPAVFYIDVGSSFLPYVKALLAEIGREYFPAS